MNIRVIRLADGTHWVVQNGVGHQITGDRQLMWARIIYGEVSQQDTADWQVGPNLLDMTGGPGSLEKIGRGEEADPFGVWLVSDSTPTNVLAGGRYVQTPDGSRFLVLDGKAWEATGPGQQASLEGLFGDPEPVGDVGVPVVGDVAGSGANDLFEPNSIEVLSGLTPADQPAVDGTFDEATLPPLEDAPPLGAVEAADPNAPSLRAQFEGEIGDRTPGLGRMEVRPGPMPEPLPSEIQPTPEPDTGTGGAGGAGGAGGGASQPTTGQQPSPAATPHPRPTVGGINPDDLVVPPGGRDGPEEAAEPPLTVPPGGRGGVESGQMIGGPAKPALTPPSSLHGLLSSSSPRKSARRTVTSRQMPAPQFPTLRNFLQRTGQDVSWLDRIEKRGK